MKAGRCFVQAVGVLVEFTVARAFGLLGPPVVAAGLLTGALVLVAWRGGATRAVDAIGHLVRGPFEGHVAGDLSHLLRPDPDSVGPAATAGRSASQ